MTSRALVNRARARALAPILCSLAAACAPASPASPAAPTPRAAPHLATGATPAASADDAGALEAPKLKLPEGVRPVRVAADLTIDPSSPRFDGRVAIELDVARPTRTLWIHATDLLLSRALLAGAGGGEPMTARVEAADADFTRLVFPREVPAGRATLTVEYTGALDATHSRGLYREKEKDAWYVYSFFEPTDARRAFPCFDEPEYKVPWALTLHVPKGDVALTNSPAVRESPEANGRKQVVFAESRPMPSYAVALIVGPFDLVERAAGPNGRPLRVAVPAGRGAEARYAADHTTELVHLLERYFDMPYPYEKLDVAVVPRYWGTMEHPGLVAMGQPLSLIRPEEETTERHERYANIAVHELAHYWFGDLVTMKWWDDTWLNEAFGSWLDEKMTDAFEPSWQFPFQRLATTQWAMREDSAESAKPVRAPITTKNDIGAAFDNGVTYGKGGAVVRMVEHWVGPERFQAVVRKYVKAFAWKNATSEDFYALLAEAQPEGPAVMRSFVDQPGLPLVTAKVSCEAGAASAKVTLRQSRFLPGASTPSSATWSIPVCMRYATGPAAHGKTARTCVLLASETMTAPLPGTSGCPAWLDANDDASGYYRVAYEGDAFERMVDAGVLGTRERLALLHDERARVSAGAAPATPLVSRLPRLGGDPDPKVVRAAAGFAASLGRNLEPALRVPFARFVRATFGARAHALGWVDRPKDDKDTRDTRRALLGFVAVDGMDEALASEARTRARAWLDDRNALRGETVADVLEVALATGDRALFDRVLAEATRTADRRERTLLLEALGSVRDPSLARAALDLVASDRFDLRESRSILDAMSSFPETRDLAFDFLLAHFDALAARLRDDEASWLVAVVASTCDEAHRVRAEAELAPRLARIDGGARALENASGAIRTCEATRKALEPALLALLRAHGAR